MTLVMAWTVERVALLEVAEGVLWLVLTNRLWHWAVVVPKVAVAMQVVMAPA